MSEERCKYTFTRGPRKSQQCPNPVVKEGYCETCLEKKNVKQTLREQCRHIFTRGPAKDLRCPAKADQDGYCRGCLARKEVRIQLEGRCTYVLTKGPRKGNRCPGEAIEGGFCRECLGKKSVRDQLKISEYPDESPARSSSSDERAHQTCGLCHSNRLHWVTVAGAGHSPSSRLDPSDGFLEGFLCLNCGLLAGPHWPHPEYESEDEEEGSYEEDDGIVRRTPLTKRTGEGIRWTVSKDDSDDQ